MKKLEILFSVIFSLLFFSCNNLFFNKINNNIISIKEKSEIVIDNIVGTVYHLEAKQCDSNPYETADGTNLKGKNINKLRYVALSRDLIKDEFRDKLHNVKGQWKGYVKFGDTIIVVSDNKELCGEWVVKDVMNKRFSKKIDFMQDKESGFYGKWNDLKIIVKDCNENKI